MSILGFETILVIDGDKIAIPTIGAGESYIPIGGCQNWCTAIGSDVYSQVIGNSLVDGVSSFTESIRDSAI